MHEDMGHINKFCPRIFSRWMQNFFVMHIVRTRRGCGAAMAASLYRRDGSGRKRNNTRFMSHHLTFVLPGVPRDNRDLMCVCVCVCIIITSLTAHFIIIKEMNYFLQICISPISANIKSRYALD